MTAKFKFKNKDLPLLFQKCKCVLIVREIKRTNETGKNKNNFI